MIPNSIFRQTAMLFCVSLAVATNSWSATTYDPAASFEQGYLSHSNPNGVWSFGHSASFTSPVALYTQTLQPGVLAGTNTQTWSSVPGGAGVSSVQYNNGPAQMISGIFDLLANQLILVGQGGENADVVFTAPQAGSYSVTGSFRGDAMGVKAVAGVTANGTLLLSSSISADAQVVPFSYTVTLPAGSTVVFSVQSAGPNGQAIGLTVAVTGPAVAQIPYYFSHLAVGGGFQTTLTYVNYSLQPVTCVTNFYSDIGSPLSMPFSGGAVSTRTDTLQPGQSIHDQTASNATAPTGGWAQATCTGAVQASLLYRLYQAGVPIGEASVNAATAPAAAFVTFAQTATGVAYANPSATQSSNITVVAYNTTGTRLGSQTITLGPLAHGAANVGPLLGIQNFTGFVKITATLPIVSLSLNAEAYPVFSSLPPGDLLSTALLIP